jgi:hypothetical protein
LRDVSSPIRFIFLKEDPERTEEVAKIEEMAWELEERIKKKGGGASSREFGKEIIRRI